MFSQDESALEESIEESELTEDDSPKKNKKRKAGKPEDKKSKVSSLNETIILFFIQFGQYSQTCIKQPPLFDQ